MSNYHLWKHCKKQHWQTMLLSLDLLGWPDGAPQKELSCLYAASKEISKHYHPYILETRSGKVRELHIPDPLLKRIQRNILHHVLDEMPIYPCATAYHKGANPLNNALPHMGKNMVVKLDISDFFDSITFDMVYTHAFPASLFPPPVRALLTNLCCLRGTLPQGAPTSAAISNLIMTPFDRHMEVWCRARGITYTRYCDDMTFSGSFGPAPLISKVRHYLDAMGFSLNEGKTRCISRHGRQAVTGVVVNERPQAPRPYRKQVRQALYYCETYGVTSHIARVYGVETGTAETNYLCIKYLQSLLGKIQYILQISPHDRFFSAARGKVLEWTQALAQA